jgi:hypothetical protein
MAIFTREFPPWSTVHGITAPGSARAGGGSVVVDPVSGALPAGQSTSGRNEQPSAAVMDTQSVKTTEKGTRGFDAHKQIKGRSVPSWWTRRVYCFLAASAG